MIDVRNFVGVAEWPKASPLTPFPTPPISQVSGDDSPSKFAIVAGRSAELCPAHFTGQNLDSMRERRCKSLDCGRGDHGRARAYATVLLCLGFQESNRATDESLRVRRRIAKKLTSAKASNRPSGRLPKATNSALYGTLQGNQRLRFPLL